jgi:hypothetical protein
MVTLETAIYTFAGKHAMSNAIVAHAAYDRVRGTSRPSPTAISAIPERYTSASGAGKTGGTIWTYRPGTTKCKVPTTTYRIAIT